MGLSKVSCAGAPGSPCDQAARPWRRPRWYVRLNVAIILAVLLAAAVARLADVTEQGIVLAGLRLPTTCSYKLVLGHRCPGCGLTRSLFLAFKGRWRQSRAAHPSGIWMAVFLLVQLLGRAALLMARSADARVQKMDLLLSLICFFPAAYLPILAAGRFA